MILVRKKCHVQWVLCDKNTALCCLMLRDLVLLCEAVANNDVQGWFVCLFPFRIQQKTPALALKSGSQLVSNSPGSWFPYHLDERDCIKTSYNLVKDRHLPVCGQSPHKMRRWNPPPYELCKEWTQGWIYRLLVCVSGHWPGHFRVKTPFPLGNLRGKLITIPTVHGLCWNNNLYKLGDTSVIHYHLPTVKTIDLIKKQYLVLCSTCQCHLYM